VDHVVTFFAFVTFGLFLLVYILND